MSATTQPLQQTMSRDASRLRTFWRSRLARGLFRNPPTVVAIIVLTIIVLGAVFGPIVIQHEPNGTDLRNTLQAPALQNPVTGHPLGTDQVGRDVLVRTMIAARISLLVGLGGATGAALVGTMIGLVAGWQRGYTGALLMRFADLQIAFPFLLLAITVAAVVGPGLVVLITLFTLGSWGTYSRVAEGLTLSISRQEFVEAARSIGAHPARILFIHVFPHLISALMVLWSFNVAIFIILEASLSFLGLGIPPPTSSLGSLLATGRAHLNEAWWLAVVPGVAISVLVWSINTVGDRVRDVIDRRMQL